MTRVETIHASPMAPMAEKVCFVLAVFFIAASMALAQGDPLKPSNMPVIDQNCADYPANVWVTGPMWKVRQDSGTAPTCTNGIAEGGKWYTAYGTQNEFVDFQVHWHDTGNGTANYSVTVSDLVQTSPNSATIPCTTAHSAQCVVYREAYIKVSFPDNVYSSKAWNTFDAGNIVASGSATAGTNATTLACSSCNFTAAGVQPNYHIVVISGVAQGAASYVTSVSQTQLSLGIPTHGQYSGNLSPGDTFRVYAPAYYPDVLIPAVDPYWWQTTNAFPFNVAAGKNQSAWIDVLIPQTAKAGYYTGTVTVKSGLTVLATLPIVIGVWQWPNNGYMPSTPTLTMLGGALGFPYLGLCTQLFEPGRTSGTTTLCGNYPGAGGNNDRGHSLVVFDADRLLADHRYPSGQGLGLASAGNFSSYNMDAGPLLNGTCNLHGGAGQTCPVLPGAQQNTEKIVLSTVNQANWQAWLANDQAQGWPGRSYDYLCDEPPGGCSWSTLVANGTTRHGYASNPGIPELVTTDYNNANANGALNSIDWMVTGVSASYNVSGTQSWLQGSQSGIPRKWLSYFGCGQAGTCTDMFPGPYGAGWTSATYPDYSVDQVAVANRVMEWETFLNGQTGELYYAEDICTYPGYIYSGFQAPCVPDVVNGSPTTTPYDPWNGIYKSGLWGDGSRIYVGTTVSGSNTYMGPGVTIPIILPSLRLKLSRDGVQDYEYLNILKQKGQGTLAKNTATSWITANDSFNVDPTAPQYGFASDLTDARNTVGKAMHHLTYPTVLQPPPSMTGTLQ